MDPWQTCLRLDPIGDANIENGVSFERAIVDFSLFRGIVVPEDTIIRRGQPTDRYNLYIEKRQTYKGIPDKKLKISEFRALMGVAFRESGQAVALATFGDWEGGHVRLSIIIPNDALIEIQKRADLGGIKGMANNPKAGHLGPGQGRPKAGWTAIATEPNPEMNRI